MKFIYPGALVRVTATLATSSTPTEITPRALKEVEFLARPRQISIERNDYNTADTCSVTMDARNFPLLPRNVRQILIQVYAGDLGGLDVDEAEIATEDKIRFIGYVDEPELSLEEDGTIELKARDYTALFLDTKRPLSAVVPSYSDNLKTALRRILDSIPGGANISLRLEGLDAWPELRTAAPAKLAKAKIPTKADDTAWHLIKRACDPVSLIPRFELDVLVVGTSRGLTVPSRRAILAYGVNVAHYQEKRHLVRVLEGIGLTAYSIEQRGYIVAVYPKTGDPTLKKPVKKVAVKKGGKPGKTSPSGVSSTEIDPNEKRAWFSYGTVSNQAALNEAAQRIFFERSRQEFSGSLKIRRMRVIQVDETDEYDDAGTYDVTTLSNGDRIMIDINPRERELLAEIPDPDARVAYLVDSLGYSPSVAGALIRSYTSGLQGPIEVYVRKAVHQFGETYECSVDFQNLILAA